LRSDQSGINVSAIDQYIDDFIAIGCATYEDDALVLDVSSLGVKKVLGSGKISKPIIVKASLFSAKAIEKIEEAGGQAITQ
jgi:large subunit ribosomal protein L15